jgi:hypothetical protein
MRNGVKDFMAVLLQADQRIAQLRAPRLALATLLAGLVALSCGALLMPSAHHHHADQDPPRCFTLRCVVDVANEP